jgi:hypothetical protein
VKIEDRTNLKAKRGAEGSWEIDFACLNWDYTTCQDGGLIMATDAAACDRFLQRIKQQNYLFVGFSQVVSECFHPGAHVYTRWTGGNILKVH